MLERHYLPWDLLSKKNEAYEKIISKKTVWIKFASESALPTQNTVEL